MKKPKKVNIVLVGGVFDILHYGHVYFLKSAKTLGDYLIVAIESDKNVKKLKGESRPIHSEEQRKEVLESLKFVDEVVILKDKMTDRDYSDLVVKIHPAVIAVTEGDPIFEKKRQQAKMIGAKVVEIKKVESPSTSALAKLINVD